MSTEEQPTINQLIENAMIAESRGVPVDWKAVALNTFNGAARQIEELEKQINPEPVD